MSDSTFLEKIVAATRIRVAERKAVRSLEQVQGDVSLQPPPLDFIAALTPRSGGVRTIAEIKRASPSKGDLNIDLDLHTWALGYAKGGAAAISVLTEQDFFKGSLNDLRTVADLVHRHNVPVLRKDFILDSYQVYEARAAGADTFLLILAMLDDNTLADLLALGRSLGMEPLVEVHDEPEMQRAVHLGAKIIGVNARDLRTFTVDTTLLARLRHLAPADTLIVAESGIATRNDVVRMRSYGAHAILVGEALVRKGSRTTIGSLTYLPDLVRMTPRRPGPIVKLCGMRTPKDALAAYEAGADLIGIILTESKRRVTPEMAKSIVNALPADALTVALFTNEPLYHIGAVSRSIGVKAVQYAVRTAEEAGDQEVTLPRILAIPTVGVHHEPSYNLVDYPHLPLLDSGVGGTGTVGNWERAADWSARFPILLAGGLTSANVSAAIAQVQPWGVDVSSGIERDGQKDPALMQAFVQAVRQTTI